MILADTNILLRVILEDDPTQARRAAKDLGRQPEGSVYVADAVAAEYIFVTTGSRYQLPRAEAAGLLGKLLTQPHFAPVNHLVMACNYFATTRLDFVDCILLAYTKLADVNILTHDKALAAVERGRPT